jgi:hypothetical protein
LAPGVKLALAPYMPGRRPCRNRCCSRHSSQHSVCRQPKAVRMLAGVHGCLARDSSQCKQEHMLSMEPHMKYTMLCSLPAAALVQQLAWYACLKLRTMTAHQVIQHSLAITCSALLPAAGSAAPGAICNRPAQQQPPQTECV